MIFDTEKAGEHALPLLLCFLFNDLFAALLALAPVADELTQQVLHLCLFIVGQRRKKVELLLHRSLLCEGLLAPFGQMQYAHAPVHL